MDISSSRPRFDLARYLSQALQDLHVSPKAIAIDIDLDPSVVYRVVRGEVTLSPRRVSDLPLGVQRAMCAAWATDLGLFIGERVRLIATARAIVEQAQQEEAAVPAAILRFPIMPDTPPPAAPRARVPAPARRAA